MSIEDAEAAFMSSGPRDRSRLSDQNVTDLWRAAMKLTAEIDEQCWLVTYAIKANWSPARLAEYDIGPGRGIKGPLGIFAEDPS